MAVFVPIFKACWIIILLCAIVQERLRIEHTQMVDQIGVVGGIAGRDSFIAGV